MHIFGRRRIYLDYASAPPVLPEAVSAMRKAEALIGNPRAIHSEGVEAKRSLETSRARIAAILGCKPREISFTSGLTESNNLAILGYARKLERSRRSLSGTHWIVSSIEHDSVLNCFSEVERLGGKVSHVFPDERGIISAEIVEAAIKSETVFVSVHWANNEIGTVEPLGEIARSIRRAEKKYGTCIAFHADAGQAPLYLKTTVESLGTNLLSLGANKLYGPHGIGAVVVRNAELASVLFGGSQERGLRPGTESVALVAGFAAAFEKIAGERDAESARLKKLRDELAGELKKSITGLVINGSLEHSLPQMLNVSIPDISSEYLTLSLDRAGIAVSTKSACNEGEAASHVVAALGGPDWRSKNTLRFSLGRDTTSANIRNVARHLARLLENSKLL